MKKMCKVFFCCLTCLYLCVTNCFAIIRNHYWWGDEYRVGSCEISGFRLQLNDYFIKVRAGNWAAVAALGIFSGGIAGVAGGAISTAQEVAMSLLLNDLARHEQKGKPIIVTIPTAIQGWSIKTQ